VKIETFEVCNDPFLRGAEVLADGITAALSLRGRCAIALSRGAELIAHLMAADLDWSAVDVFQADERAAPEGPDRNIVEIATAVERVTGGRPRVHAMPVSGDLRDGARSYAAELEAVCGSVLDVVHLGLGPDGHTASLVPGDPVLDVRDTTVAATGPYQGQRRMTLTYAALDAARLVVFVVAGESKRGALAAVRAGDAAMPAARIEAAHVRFVVDDQAAGEPGNSP
jgi:6-phosphogluconolactonase/glucosamine-6-phosphate isomerase/deaminase